MTDDYREQEMVQDWSHCLDVELEFKRNPEAILRHLFQRERQDAREQERARLEPLLKEALRYTEEAHRAGDFNDTIKRRQMMEELLLAVSRLRDALLPAL